MVDDCFSGTIRPITRLARPPAGRRLGASDRRARATWRVLLAVPVLWVLTGGVLAGTVQSAIDVLPSGRTRGSGLAQSLLYGGFFLVALLGWARYLDRRPLSDYGVSVSPGWIRDGLVGFVAVLVGFAVWIGILSGLGATTVVVSPSLPQGSPLLGPVLPFAALVLHAAVQQVVFFRVVLGTAAGGLSSRGVGAGGAAAGAVAVATLSFVAMHGDATPLRVVDLAVVGGISALFSLHSGEVALGLGAQSGALCAGPVVSAVVRVTSSPAGVLGALDPYGFPKLVVAYPVVVAWLIRLRGEIGIWRGIVRWSDD